MRGGQTFKVGQYAIDHLRYAPATLTIRSGGTVTLVDKDPSGQEPHTFTLLKASQLPHSDKQIGACETLKLPACRAAAVAHGVDPNNPPHSAPPKIQVDVGAPGFDQSGDSVFIAPGFTTLALKITAKAGTTLHYFCLIHPWMQGQIKVVK